METYAEIQQLLELDGEVLTFASGTLLACKGISTSLLRQEPSFSEVEQQEFNFYASTQDLLNFIIDDETTFTTTDGLYIYSFLVLRNPIHYTDGWSRIPATLTGKIPV